MEIFTQPPTIKGPAETFTGDVWVDLVHAGPEPGRASWDGKVTDADYAAPRATTR